MQSPDPSFEKEQEQTGRSRERLSPDHSGERKHTQLWGRVKQKEEAWR
jgi:hypothetical protein